ncbi:MAG: methyltransferase [Bdellovibrionales bacterium]
MPSKWKQTVIKTFDGGAKHYDQNNEIQIKTADTLISLAPTIENPSILEIGCGTGTLTQKLIKHYPDATFHITDISEKMLKTAQCQCPSNTAIQWGLMDGEKPNHLKSYDIIISNMAFQWFETPEQSIKSLTKHLNPNGSLLYSVPASNSFKQWRSTLSGLSLPYGFKNHTQWPDITKEEAITIDYKTTRNFLKTLKAIGASTPTQNYKRLSFTQLQQACAHNDQKNGGQTTWNIQYGHYK